ncbi:MAG: hypothetical protein LBT50_03945 [Prevotellaceae bacterium]|jgi:hypothetical protein|nr:hypothetical protein [Prevotellaceae bacterium]
MKKSFFMIAVMAIFAAIMITGCGGSKQVASTPQVATTPQQAVLSLKEQRAAEQQKMYSTRLTELKKDGWKLSGSTKTLEVALLDHYIKLYDDENGGYGELSGEVSQCKSINICRQAATNNAINEYANLTGSYVKGKLNTAIAANANIPSAEVDLLVGGLERFVAAEIKGVLTESFSLVKEEAGGNRQYKSFFLVSKAAESAARTKAMEDALKETKITMETAKEISKFVNE